jgi:hypothetical protein
VRYFIDANVEQQQMSVLAEDGRELMLHAGDEDSDLHMRAFFDQNIYGPATVWMYDAEMTAPFVASLGVPGEVKDLKDWAAVWRNPTLPGKTAGAPGAYWVRDAWAFMCRYTGEPMDPEPLLPVMPVAEEAPKQKDVKSP